MKKVSFIIALLGIAFMAQANSINCSFSGNGKGGYSCDLSSASFVVPTGCDITSCTITFSSNYGFQNCNLFGGNNSCNLLSDFNKNNCTLDSSALSCLNNYLFSSCNLNLNCSSRFNGKCTITYTCSPHKTNGVPEAASTAALLAIGLVSMFYVRRQLVPVKK